MPNNYNYIIVGGGLAGMQLALELSRDPFFKNKKIGIIDPFLNSENNKTWCFWEKETGKWDEIVSKSWESGLFFSSEAKIDLKLKPYRYKMIHSADFHAFIKQKLNLAGNFHFIKDEILKIDRKSMKAVGKKGYYHASHFFDSRVPESFFNSEKSSKLQQHFKGWFIETEEAVFNPQQFTMMDYRLVWQNTTSFTYVLPITETMALVEFTFFSPSLVEEQVYDEMLEKYISEILQIKKYNILKTEKGNIPMTDFPFHKTNDSKVTKIGTGGGWVKASTGYSFKNTEKKISKLLLNIKKGTVPGENLINQKFRNYDGIFLDVLVNNNEIGPQVFKKLYSKNTPQEIFKYLDEETRFPEDMKLMISLFSHHFIMSFFSKNI